MDRADHLGHLELVGRADPQARQVRPVLTGPVEVLEQVDRADPQALPVQVARQVPLELEDPQVHRVHRAHKVRPRAFSTTTSFPELLKTQEAVT